MSEIEETIRWQISVPIFKNRVILKQLAIAIGIPFGLLAVILVIVSGRSIYLLYALGLIGALLALTWLLVMVVYRGQYEAEFVLDRKGALCRTQARQARKNRLINGLTVFLGLLSGRPAAAGAGVLAQSRQEVLVRWSRVAKVKYQPEQRIILLRGGFAENIALFCTQENYPHVEQLVKQCLEDQPASQP